MDGLKYPPFYDRTDLYLYNEWQNLGIIQRAYVYLMVQKKIKKNLAHSDWHRELRQDLMSETDEQKIKFDQRLVV